MSRRGGLHKSCSTGLLAVATRGGEFAANRRPTGHGYSPLRSTNCCKIGQRICGDDDLPLKNIKPLALPSAARIAHKNRRSFLFSARATTVNIHVVSSGRNCRETIASLRNARVTCYHITNFLCCIDRQRLRRPRYDILARISSVGRYAEREGEDPNCRSDRPAAHATQSGSFSHVVILLPVRILSKLNLRSTSYFSASPLRPPPEVCFSRSRGNVQGEYC